MRPNIVKVLDLPIPESGCGGVRLIMEGVDLVVEYQYRDTDDLMDHVGAIQFLHVMAFQFRDELHSLGFQPESFNCLVEVLDSRWKRKIDMLGARTVAGEAMKRRHFAVLFDSHGYLEVLAEGFQELPGRIGTLESGSRSAQ